MKSIHTPVSTRASSLAAHFDTSRAQYDRQALPPRSHSTDSMPTLQQPQITPLPLSNSPPPLNSNTPGSTSNSAGGRPKLSLHIPDDEDAQQGEESGGSPTPGTASPEINRSGGRQENIKMERSEEGQRRGSQGEAYFLPPPNSATSALLPNGRPTPGLGGFDNSNNGGGTPLSALPSRYAGDLLPSPSTFYPEFFGSLPSAGTSNIRGGFSSLMNGTPVVGRAEEAGNTGFGGYPPGNGGNGEKRRSEEAPQGTNKRTRT
jgi:transcription factor RLM1